MVERRTQMEHIAGLFRGYNATLLIDLCVKQGVFAALARREGTALQQWIEIFWGNVFLSPEQQRRMLEDAGFEVLSQDVVPPGLVCATVARRPGGARRSRAESDA